MLKTISGRDWIGRYYITRGVSNFGPLRPVFIHEETNQLAFQLEDAENKIEGCKLDAVIETAFHLLKELDAKMPCPENRTALAALDTALGALAMRRYNRMHENTAEGADK